MQARAFGGLNTAIVLRLHAGLGYSLITNALPYGDGDGVGCSNELLLLHFAAGALQGLRRQLSEFALVSA